MRFSKPIFIIISFLLISNIVLLYLNINLRKQIKKDTINSNIVLSQEPYKENNSLFFNEACPDIEMYTINGKKIVMSDFVGDVVLIRFTRFHQQDIPYLIYLEHLYYTFKEKGLRMFFIKLLGKKRIISDNNYNSIIPIIEDDGYIAAMFNARLNDTIIIGKDFKIKFKNNQVVNRIIYDQVMKFLDTDDIIQNPSKKELESIIKELSYINIKNNREEKLIKGFSDSSVIINVFTSACLNCPLHGRILLLNNLAGEVKKNIKIYILFGEGNSQISIKQALGQYNSSEMIIGIIKPSKGLFQKNYYNIFKLDTDPRLFILDKKGRIVYLEDLRNQSLINLEFLKRKMK